MPQCTPTKSFARGCGEPGVIKLQSPAKLRHSSGPFHRSEDEQRAFFNAALDCTQEAEAKAGTIERCFAVAGFVLNVKFAGDTLAQWFTPALAHLEVPLTSRTDAVFHIWDSESTGIDMSSPPCSRGCFTSCGDIWTMGSQRFKSAYLGGEYALNLFDTVTATGVYWTQASGSLPYWAKASPLRCLFHWWAETKSCQLVHAAAVGSEAGAVLISGKGGLGKSTTALSCLGKGLTYIGDDYVVVQLDPFPRVHSLYCTAKLNWDQVARFPRLADLAGNHDGPESEKAVMYLYPEMHEQIARSLPLRAILTPHISGQQQTELAAISTLALQRAIAFTTMSQLPHAGPHTQHFINRLIDRLPGLQLDLGNNLDTIADVIVPLAANSSSKIECLSYRTDSKELTSRPLISVIIPVYNGARFLPESVASILVQKYPNIEIIVVDDGSTDEIDDVVPQLPVDVRFLKQDYATGLAAARNRGILEASGELITFLDVENLWPDGNLQIMVDLLSDDSSCDVVQGLGQVLKADAETGPRDFVGIPGESFPNYLAAAIYRREVFLTVGLFDRELGFGEDTDWFNRAREHGLKLRQLDQVTLLIRHHDASMIGGKSLRDLNSLMVLKNALDRERAAIRLPSKDTAPSASGHRHSGMQDPQPKSWPLHHRTNTDLNVWPSISKLHQGINYNQYLKQIHQVWKPSSYLEIGVETGATLAFAQCRAVAIDPKFRLRGNPIGQRTETYLFQLKSDDFFAQHDLRRFLPDGVDFAFLDGMHYFEYLLRDLLNTEKYSHKDLVVALHDCYPVNTEMANREVSWGWWAGDVWKLLPILRDFRPDLDVTILDCPPTGLTVIRGLNPNSKVFIERYDEIVAQYRDINLDTYGIERFRKEFSTADSRRVFQPNVLRNFFKRQT